MKQDFIKEDIKKKPINKSKIIKKTITMILSGVLFGVVASVIILVLEPFLKRITTRSDEPVAGMITLPEEEMNPEEMLSEYMMQESALSAMTEEEVVEAEPVEIPLSEDQITAILSRFKFDATKYRQMMISMANYARELGNYTVTITAIKSSVDWLNSVNDSSNVTSGIVIAKNRVELLILADSKPLQNFDSLTMSVRGSITVPAYIKEVDEVTGLAIIGVSLSNIPKDFDTESIIVPLGSSNGIYVGMSVVAVGSPQGVSGSVGYGIVDIPKTMVTYVDTYISKFHTDILGSKNASGVLFNMQGQVVGIITNKETESGANTVITAYGITELKNIIERMSNNQKIGYLGITGTNVTSTVNSENGIPMGAFVTSTEMGSPSMLAGVQVGDVIVGMKGQAINSYTDYVNCLQNCDPGETVKLNIQRKSKDEYVPIDIELIVSSR